jgi:hypothetical protein
LAYGSTIQMRTLIDILGIIYWNWVQNRLCLCFPKLATTLDDVSAYKDSEIRKSKISDHSPLVITLK